jgi:hypothetical protein
LPLVIRGGTDASGHVLTGLLKPVIGSPPWTITVALAGFANKAEASPNFMPIILYDSADDKAETLDWFTSWGGPYGGVTEVEQWSGATPGDSRSIGGVGYGFPFLDYFAWFRRVKDDGTNITYYISPDGLQFEEVYSEPSGSFLGTINKVGFGYDRVGDGNGVSPSEVADVILWGWQETSP